MWQPQDFIIMQFFQIKWSNSSQVIFYYLLPKVTWTNDFLNQQAIFTAMKSRAHFLISSYVWQGNPSDDKSLITVLFVSDQWQKLSLKERTKEKCGKYKSKLATSTVVISELLLFCVRWGLVGVVKFSVLHYMTSCQSFTSLFILHYFKQFFGDEATTPRICAESDFKLSNYINCLKY